MIRTAMKTSTYNTSGIPSSAQIYLQRQYGTAHLWKSVKRLRALNSSTTAPEVPIGRFANRVDVVSGRATTTSPLKTLYSYGAVPLETLCKVPQSGSGGGSLGTQSSKLVRPFLLTEADGTAGIPNTTQLSTSRPQRVGQPRCNLHSVLQMDRTTRTCNSFSRRRIPSQTCGFQSILGRGRQSRSKSRSRKLKSGDAKTREPQARLLLTPANP